MPELFAPSDRLSGQVELKKMKLCLYLVNYFHYVSAKFHTNRTTFSVKRLARRKVAQPKRANFTRCSTYSASNKKTWVKGNVGSWDSACSLINYLHYVSAIFQPNRTTFRVKVLATKEMVKRKITKLTRSSTYSVFGDKISSHRELNKMKLCM